MTIAAGRNARAFRAPRAVLLGFSSTALAVAAHGMAGGRVPDTAVTVALTALVGWAGSAVAERHHGLVPMLALLGTSQLSLHVLLTHIADTHPGEPGGPAFSTPLMLATHAAATLLTAVLLTRASTAFAAVAAALRGLVRAIAVVLSTWSPAPSPAPVEPDPDHLISAVLRRSLGRRGPPVLS
ncbi:hypothetical protein L6E12_17425 [Actinokineospora sp. PR83]|uniref:hypothetical protein n=1 Tax=Actinokineospora sp. PR83 TaxID=2884908 RepID=UPI001F488BE0|nr:hypothetical protein [Actinokineospora sp. PR83]MCG8917567.1 hypothetical protein [Actinokineospora sp. PR83]